jgi:hypothetical protein
MPLLVPPVPGTADVGDTWRIYAFVSDRDGNGAAPDSIACTVTKPDLTTAAATVTPQSATGLYLITFDLVTAGRFTAVLTVTSATFDDDVAFLAVEARTGGVARPVLADVQTYLGASASQWTSPQLQDALDAESDAQRAVCRIPSAYPRSLREALLRRVAVLLAKRLLPLMVPQGDSEGGPTFIPARDPEVRRLEAPWRRRKVG